ncbi:HD domain-containing protein [Haloarchaeobius amylolyticus]|uniref:HD domain-containing protein n=1 Tax=Haloarchaeobius amylolyticus TaxID=1198296 RepID=UPI00226EFFF0|nr:HD family hydrolase [Haloarchaeobius amylolyticus]
MTDEDPQESDPALEPLLSALALKDETRTGWQLRGVVAPESVAAHSWGVAYLTLLFAEQAGVDPDRALRLAVVHDVAEAETGDWATRADETVDSYDPAEKEAAETAAAADLLAGFEHAHDAWAEYEARATPEARFVKDMDLVDMCLQAVVYEREDRYEPGDAEAFAEYDHLDEFFATAEPRLNTEFGRELFEAAKEAYEAVRG